MSVEITIEPPGLHGLVAEQTSLLNAARRLGLRLPAECKGQGACDSCAVTIKAGADLLSPATPAEEDLLGPEKLAAGERLACQTCVTAAGEVTFAAVPREDEVDAMRDFHKEFSELPLTKKFATLFRLELDALNEAVGSIMNLPSQIGGLGVDFLAQKGRAADAPKPDAPQPETTAEETPPDATPEN